IRTHARLPAMAETDTPGFTGACAGASSAEDDANRVWFPACRGDSRRDGARSGSLFGRSASPELPCSDVPVLVLGAFPGISSRGVAARGADSCAWATAWDVAGRE